MEPKKIALLVGALLVAVVSAVMAKSMFAKSAAPQAVAAAAPVPTGPEVLVATRALPVGTILSPDAFRYQPWPKDLVENAYFLKGQSDMAALNGTVVRTAVTAGQPLTQGALVKPGDRGFLAAALGPGMRAVTVSVSAATGVAGFVFPGDRVDLVLSQSISGASGPALRTSETFVRNLRVLATDQRTVPEDAEGKREVRTFTLVTLEVTPKIAEKVSVAQSIGQVSLSLRSIADNTADLDQAIASGEVNVGKDMKPGDKPSLIQVASRPSDMGSTFVTGADVSRFQRRTVPPAEAPGSAGPAGAAGTLGAPPAKPVQVPGAAAEPTWQGPTVRVARGNDVARIVVKAK